MAKAEVKGLNSSSSSSSSEAEEEGAETLRVVLLGKTGAGKSSTGNTLLGREAFRVARGLMSGTERCQWADELVRDISLQVTDTPGLSDTHRPEEEVLKEVGKSIAVASPGPHVIMMVARCDARFTKEEFMAYFTLKTMFGSEIKKYMIVVFVGADNHGDTLEEQQKTVGDLMEEATGPLKELLDDAGRRFYAINNKASYDLRQQQAAELIDLMRTLKRGRGGQYYQNSISDSVNQLVAPLVENRTAGGLMPRAQAIRETNLAIVEERESPGFFSDLLDTLQTKVLPLVKKAVHIAAQGIQIAGEVCKLIVEVREGPVGESCSLM